jgi:hypothetical protein
MSTKSFTRWTEEERRANIRSKTMAFQGRKEDRISMREKEYKEKEKNKREDRKKLAESGGWVTAEKVMKPEKKVNVKTVLKTVNAFASLDMDEKEEVKVEAWTGSCIKKSINWADSDSDEE